mmetsp:Transcript_83404/g.223152  ORF Transcript_83404/g.223152 Transcript_83404/m.223152 type:complete len:615 (+) Transcript_83404:129-1973(+)
MAPVVAWPGALGADDVRSATQKVRELQAAEAEALSVEAERAAVVHHHEEQQKTITGELQQLQEAGEFFSSIRSSCAEAVRGIPRRQMVEIRQLKHPPAAVRRVLEATWFALKCDKFDANKAPPDNVKWAAVSKMLASEGFLKAVAAFDVAVFEKAPHIASLLRKRYFRCSGEANVARVLAEPAAVMSRYKKHRKMSAVSVSEVLEIRDAFRRGEVPGIDVAAVDFASKSCVTLVRWLSAAVHEFSVLCELEAKTRELQTVSKLLESARHAYKESVNAAEQARVTSRSCTEKRDDLVRKQAAAKQAAIDSLRLQRVAKQTAEGREATREAAKRVPKLEMNKERKRPQSGHGAARKHRALVEIGKRIPSGPWWVSVQSPPDPAAIAAGIEHFWDVCASGCIAPEPLVSVQELFDIAVAVVGLVPGRPSDEEQIRSAVLLGIEARMLAGTLATVTPAEELMEVTVRPAKYGKGTVHQRKARLQLAKYQGFWKDERGRVWLLAGGRVECEDGSGDTVTLDEGAISCGLLGAVAPGPTLEWTRGGEWTPIGDRVSGCTRDPITARCADMSPGSCRRAGPRLHEVGRLLDEEGVRRPGQPLPPLLLHCGLPHVGRTGVAA